MIFTTPCFVRVEDAEKRKELIEWLENVGYIFNNCYNGAYSVAISPYSITKIVKVESSPGTGLIHVLVSTDTGINCDDNIEMFKALAAKNNYNDKEQWFTDGIDWRLCHDSIITKMVIPNYALYRKATAQEIIEHFNRKQI